MAARALLVLAVFAFAPPAHSQRLAADLSSNEVAISTGFSGAELLLFGATEGYGDIVVTVVGPLRDEVVRRKQWVAGIWVNGASVTFHRAPAYYRIAATRPLTEIAAPDVLEKLQIGVDRIELFTRSKRPPAEIMTFREALIRNKKRAELYSKDVSDIRLVRDLLFRSTIPFPATVPIGEYQVTVYLFKDGKPVSSQKTPLPVRKVGMEAQIYNFAHQNAAWYGAIAILIALVAGWLAGVIFKRA